MEQQQQQQPDTPGGKCFPEVILDSLKTGDEARALELLREVTTPAGVTEVKDWGSEDDGSSLLHWAALGGFDAVIMHLVTRVGMNVDARTKANQTPLMWAVTEQHLISICLLLDLGADVNARDNLQDNSLTLAAQHEKLYAAILLISRGIDVNAASVTKTTPAHWAAFSGNYLILALLESAGADLIESYDRFGMLPFHRALQLEYYAVARMLVSFIPRLLDVETDDGKTLKEFREAQDLPSSWIDEFVARCKDPSHKPPSAKLVFPTSEDENPSWWEVRKRAWRALAGWLLRMEEKPAAKKLIPLLASMFGVIFVLSYRIGLRPVNNLLESKLEGFLPFSYGALTLLKLWPYVGVVAVVIFHVLLLQDPGYLPERNERKTVFNQYRALLGNLQFLWELRGGNRRVGDTKPRPLDKDIHEWLKRKGVKTEVTDSEWKRAKDVIDPKRICPTCWIQKGLRTKHCSVCDRCCDMMDHHCLWLDRCVGSQNHQLFALFLLAGGVAQTFHSGLTILALLLAWSPVSWHPNWPHSMSIWATLAVILGAIIHFVTMGWSWSLIQMQFGCIMKGMTVNETLSLARYDHFIVPVEDPGYPEGEKTAKDSELAEMTFPGQIQAEEVNEGTFIRKFTRNPFSVGTGRVQNLKDFWLGHRPTAIQDYNKLEEFDKKFVTETQAKIRDKRRRNRALRPDDSRDHRA